MTQTP